MDTRIRTDFDPGLSLIIKYVIVYSDVSPELLLDLYAFRYFTARIICDLVSRKYCRTFK